MDEQIIALLRDAHRPSDLAKLMDDAAMLIEQQAAELKRLRAADSFWKETYDGIPMTGEQVRNELKDFHFMMKQVPKVYMAVTGGLLSKTNYYAESVISAFEDCQEKEIARCVKEKTEELKQELKQLKEEYIALDGSNDHPMEREEELLGVIEKLRAERAWQDISTAPERGTIIGTWKNGKWYAAAVWWDDSVEEWTDTRTGYYCDPTHWIATPDKLTLSAQSGEEG